MMTYRFTLAALGVAALLFSARPAAGQGGITFSFDNLEVTSQGVAFDVLAKAEQAGARLGDTQVYLAYDASAFGTHVDAGGRVSAALGEALADAGRYGAPIVNDNNGSRVSLTAEFLGEANEGYSLPESPIVLLHVTMQPVSGGDKGRITFYEPLMEGQQYTSDLSKAFTGVTVGGLLEADVTKILGPVLQVATAGAGAVQLDWTSQSGGFEVEHAEGTGDAFRPVAFIDKPAKDGRFVHRVDGLELGTHRFRLRQMDEAGNVMVSEAVEVTVEMAEDYLLDPVYPNPFNPEATIRFAVKEAEGVRIELYNALGQRVRVLYEDTPQAGTYQKVTLDGSDLAGDLYIVRLQGESFAATQRVMLVK